jgi:hypothetical protein
MAGRSKFNRRVLGAIRSGSRLSGSGTCLTVWLRHLHDTSRTRLPGRNWRRVHAGHSFVTEGSPPVGTSVSSFAVIVRAHRTEGRRRGTGGAGTGVVHHKVGTRSQRAAFRAGQRAPSCLPGGRSVGHPRAVAPPSVPRPLRWASGAPNSK